MKKKNKIRGVLFFTVAMLLCSPCTGFAVEPNIDEYIEEFDMGSVLSSLDDEALAILNEIGINEISYEEIFNVQPQKVFDALFNIVSDAIKAPLQFVVVTFGILIISTLLSSFLKSSETISLVGGSAIALGAAVPIANVVTTAFSVLEVLGFFTTAFTGVFCAVVSASGNISGSVTYSAMTVFSDALFSGILTELSFPIVNAMCALSFLSCFDVFEFSSKLSRTVKKVYVFFLSFIGTVFSGLITVKGVLSNGVDSLTSKSIRFVVGRSLPVVGGTVSETYSALVSSLGLIKNTVGVFGIITVTVTVLPILLELIMWILALDITISASDAFGTSKALGMFGVLKDTLVLLVATVVIVATIFIVSVGVVIAARN